MELNPGFPDLQPRPTTDYVSGIGLFVSVVANLILSFTTEKKSRQFGFNS